MVFFTTNWCFTFTTTVWVIVEGHYRTTNIGGYLSAATSCYQVYQVHVVRSRQHQQQRGKFRIANCLIETNKNMLPSEPNAGGCQQHARYRPGFNSCCGSSTNWDVMVEERFRLWYHLLDLKRRWPTSVPLGDDVLSHRVIARAMFTKRFGSYSIVLTTASTLSLTFEVNQTSRNVVSTKWQTWWPLLLRPTLLFNATNNDFSSAWYVQRNQRSRSYYGDRLFVGFINTIPRYSSWLFSWQQISVLNQL